MSKVTKKKIKQVIPGYRKATVTRKCSECDINRYEADGINKPIYCEKYERIVNRNYVCASFVSGEGW
jgi:hypothetical protein